VKVAQLIVSILGFGGTIVALTFGFRQYRRAEAWKRGEFVAREIKEFQLDPLAVNAMQMIDWGERRINLYLKECPEYVSCPRVDRKILGLALLPHEIKAQYPSPEIPKVDIAKTRFTPDEVRIRDTFDVFLNYLQRFGNFIAAKLISAEELEPYLKYWLGSIASENPDADIADDEMWRCVLLAYINHYGYTGVVNLFKAFEYDISPSAQVFERLIARMEDKQLGNTLLEIMCTQTPTTKCG